MSANVLRRCACVTETSTVDKYLDYWFSCVITTGSPEHKPHPDLVPLLAALSRFSAILFSQSCPVLVHPDWFSHFLSASAFCLSVVSQPVLSKSLHFNWIMCIPQCCKQKQSLLRALLLCCCLSFPQKNLLYFFFFFFNQQRIVVSVGVKTCLK